MRASGKHARQTEDPLATGGGEGGQQGILREQVSAAQYAELQEREGLALPL